MTVSPKYLEKLRQRVSSDRSNSLPAEFCERMLSEGREVGERILAPKGLDDRKVLVIGGAGYIGTPLTTWLLSRGYSVRCLDLLL